MICIGHAQVLRYRRLTANAHRILINVLIDRSLPLPGLMNHAWRLICYAVITRRYWSCVTDVRKLLLLLQDFWRMYEVMSNIDMMSAVTGSARILQALRGTLHFTTISRHCWITSVL